MTSYKCNFRILPRRALPCTLDIVFYTKCCFKMRGRKERASRTRVASNPNFPGQEKKNTKNMNMLTRPYRTPRLSTPRSCSNAADRRCSWCRILRPRTAGRTGRDHCCGGWGGGGMAASYSVKKEKEKKYKVLGKRGITWQWNSTSPTWVLKRFWAPTEINKKMMTFVWCGVGSIHIKDIYMYLYIPVYIKKKSQCAVRRRRPPHERPY